MTTIAGVRNSLHGADDIEDGRSGNTDRLYRVTLDCLRACVQRVAIRSPSVGLHCHLNVAAAGDREAPAPRAVPMAERSSDEN